MSIDLRAAVVGDEFDSLNERYELLMKSEKDYVIKGCGARLYIVDRHGSSYEPDAVKLMSKHDPRHWLGQLPDADLFDGTYLAVEGIDSLNWYVFNGEPMIANDSHFSTNGMFVLQPITGIKMPTLTVDEWKKSKISIDDLRAWQKENKTRGQ